MFINKKIIGKHLILTILVLRSVIGLGQLSSVRHQIQFKIIEYVVGTFYSKKVQTVDTIGLGAKKIDLFFFKKYFDSPYYLPKKFVDLTHKNFKMVVPYGEQNADYKGQKTFTYDSLSRIVKYTNSSCVICSFMPYTYDVSYNSGGEVKTISSEDNLSDSYNIFYDHDGNIWRIDCLLLNKLEKQIIRIK
jgi:hypothetical protein